MFDQIAHRYDFLNHFLSLGRDVAWRKASCKSLSPQNNTVLLDLCGGTGDFSLAYRQWVGLPLCTLVGDFSFQMLQRCFPKDPSLLPVQLDAMHLPLPSQSIDTALNGFGMRNVPDVATVLQEVHRVLKPHGQYLTLEFFRPTNVFTHFFYGVLAPLAIPLVGFLFSGKKSAYDYLVRSIRGFMTVQQYAELAKKQGFQVQSIHACDGGIAHRVLLVKEAL